MKHSERQKCRIQNNPWWYAQNPFRKTRQFIEDGIIVGTTLAGTILGAIFLGKLGALMMFPSFFVGLFVGGSWGDWYEYGIKPFEKGLGK